jgi:Fe-S cluster assembly protein SufD
MFMIQLEDINQYFSEFLTTYPLSNGSNSHFKQLRKDAAEQFRQQGLPKRSNEMWREMKWDFITKNKKYIMQTEPKAYQPVENYFQCSTEDINADMFTFLNGWYVHKNAPLTLFPDGIIVGSLREAIIQFPDLVSSYLAKNKEIENGLTHLNLALWQDGFFAYIPDNIHVKRPIQIVYIVNSDENIFIQPRNLICLGDNASVKIVHCDDSLECKETLINTVTEIYVGNASQCDYFKLENKDNQSSLINHLLIQQKALSKVNTNTTVFNGGMVHNTIAVSLTEPKATVNTNGLYLVDKNQDISNCLFIKHHAPDCNSNQLYKGILDDSAKAKFVGHIFVEKDAQKTEAHQTNRNILLTDQANVLSKPFLEIYADDVKCSHGSTVGQLDEEAMFYLRSRGICEQNARILLMHAFAKEVVDKISIEALSERTERLVRKRLTGEIISCNNCMQACDKKSISFEIEVPELQA